MRKREVPDYMTSVIVIQWTIPIGFLSRLIFWWGLVIHLKVSKYERHLYSERKKLTQYHEQNITHNKKRIFQQS